MLPSRQVIRTGWHANEEERKAMKTFLHGKDVLAALSTDRTKSLKDKFSAQSL